MKTETFNEVERLDCDGIEYVGIVEPLKTVYADYAERPSRYIVRLVGETRPRRVYATPIGNVSVLYIKTMGRKIYVEAALDAALHRKEERSN